jgi:uncharacterized protein YabN with tetrapyrrole methylase and pyrophosphatase domain
MTDVDLYLLGSGIRSTLQFTRETIQAIQACRVVFVLHDDTAVHDFVRTLCGDVRDLIDLYSEHEVRADVYRAISDLLVAEAQRGSGVAFLVHGHPLFLVSATEYTLEQARTRNLKVRMLPGVSSFDTILCDLEVDYGYGLQIFDPTTMMSCGWKPNPAVPMLIFQLATTLNGKVVRDLPAVSVLEPLRQYLCETYPEDHLCTVIYSAAHLLERPARSPIRLGDLAQNEDIELWRRPTLYVPAVS